MYRHRNRSNSILVTACALLLLVVLLLGQTDVAALHDQVAEVTDEIWQPQDGAVLQRQGADQQLAAGTRKLMMMRHSHLCGQYQKTYPKFVAIDTKTGKVLWKDVSTAVNDLCKCRNGGAPGEIPGCKKLFVDTAVSGAEEFCKVECNLEDKGPAYYQCVIAHAFHSAGGLNALKDFENRPASGKLLLKCLQETNPEYAKMGLSQEDGTSIPSKVESLVADEQALLKANAKSEELILGAQKIAETEEKKVMARTGLLKDDVKEMEKITGKPTITDRVKSALGVKPKEETKKLDATIIPYEQYGSKSSSSASDKPTSGSSASEKSTSSEASKSKTDKSPTKKKYEDDGNLEYNPNPQRSRMEDDEEQQAVLVPQQSRYEDEGERQMTLLPQQSKYDEDDKKKKGKGKSDSDDESSDDESSGDESSGDESSDDEASDDEASDDEASDDEASDDEGSDDEGSDDEASDDEGSDDEASDDEASDDEGSDDEASDDEASDDEGSDDEGSDDEGSDDEGSDDGGSDDEEEDEEDEEDDKKKKKKKKKGSETDSDDDEEESEEEEDDDDDDNDDDK